VVVQISTANNTVAGPKEAIVTKNSNVAGPKEAIVSNSSVSGPRVAYSTRVAGPSRQI